MRANDVDTGVQRCCIHCPGSITTLPTGIEIEIFKSDIHTICTWNELLKVMGDLTIVIKTDLRQNQCNRIVPTP